MTVVTLESQLDAAIELGRREDPASRRRAIEDLEALRPEIVATGAPELVVEVDHHLGSVHADLGELGEAVFFLERALALAEEEQADGLLPVVLDLGVVFSRLKRIEPARAAYQRAIGEAEKRQDAAAKAKALNGLGRVASTTGRPHEALRFYRQALPIFEQLENENGQGLVLSNMAAILDTLGRAHEAIELYERALAIFRRLNKRLNEAVTLNNLGTVHVLYGDPRAALEVLSASLEIRRQLGDRLRQAAALGNIAAAHHALGENEKARDNLRQGLAACRSEVGAPCRDHLLNNLAMVELSLADMEAALTAVEQSLALRRSGKDKRGQSASLTVLCRVRLERGELDEAEEAAHAALALGRTLEDPFVESTSLFLLARIDRKRGRLHEARSKMASAFELLEQIRSYILSQRLRASFLGSKAELVDFYVDLLMELDEIEESAGHDREAFALSEKMRARALRDLIAEHQAEIRRGVDTDLLQHKEEVAAELVRLQRRAEKETGDVRKQIHDQALKLDRIEARIRARSPRYSELVAPRPVIIEEIQRQLDGSTVWLRYELGEEGSFLFLLTGDVFESFRLGPAAEIEAPVRRLHRWLAGGSQELGRLNAEADAERLSELLLAPAARHLVGNSRLVIVKERALHFLPFAMLPDPNVGKASGQLLIDRFEVLSVPSAAALNLIRSARQRPTVYDVAIVADAVFSAVDERLESLEFSAAPQLGSTRKESDLSRLPHSRREAEAISRLVAPERLSLWLGFDARKEVVQSEVFRQARVLHFATHAHLDPHYPLLSGLVLSQVDRSGEPIDGMLRTLDIYNLELSAELVVLSGCSTGLGRDVPGEGLVGLTYGFWYAGVQSIVASLWSVEDPVTADLMEEFYRGYLEDGLGAAAALRRAQLEIRRRFPAPARWAAFTLTGEWQAPPARLWP